MRLDLEVMHEVHQSNVTAAAARTFGSDGDELARRLLVALPYVHANLPLELLPDGLVVFVAVDDGAVLAESSSDLLGLESVQAHPYRGFTVQVTRAGYRVLPSVVDPTSLPLSVSYHFAHPRQETWRVGGEESPVFNPLQDWPSSFATPLFTKLEEALDDYALKMVQECRCLILTRGWLNEKRIYWRQKPEEEVRRSLEAHLASSLRDAIVEVEHIVDESKEVDVIVQWSFSKNVALIECKWMGVSTSEPGVSGKRLKTRFGPADAVSGLQQLGDYLDRQRTRAAGRSLKGHLVVIDGRRRGTGDPDDGRTYSQEDLLYYEHRDIVWPERLLARTDLARPRRMFCRPRL